MENNCLNTPVDGSAEPVQNAQPIQNSILSDAILGFNPGVGRPGFSQQVSQVDTIFVNLRGYLISNMRQPLNQAYAEIGLIRTIIDTPVNDAFRGGVDIKSKQLSPEELEELHYTMEQENDIGQMAQSQKWDRLFGGAGVIIITGDDWETPLDLPSIQQGDPISFRAVDMWELFWDKQNIDGDGEPIESETFQYYNYYGKQVHKSRVLVTKGIKAPSFIRPRLRGWGMSVVETLIRSINQYLKATDLIFEVLDEFKIDVYKIKNFANTLLSPNGAQKVQERIQIANQQKNFQSAITMDGEDDYIQKELSFAGLSETMTGIRMQVASEMNMPISKIFGIASSGFSSGEDDIENYNAMIESTIRTPSKFHLIKMVKVRCQSLFGYVPQDLQVGFKSLRILSSEQEENVKTQKFTRLLAARTAGEIVSKEFRDGCNKAELLPLQLETDDESINEELDQAKQEVASKGEAQPSSKGSKSKTQAPEAAT